MEYLPEFFTIAFINFLGILSPGPAFALTVHNSLKYSKKIVLYTALGLALGESLQVLNSIFGMGLIISSSGPFFSIVKIVGSIYLVYIGYKSLTDKPFGSIESQKKEITKHSALIMGFLTNATNPKGFIFALSLYTLIVSQTTPIAVKALYGLENTLAEFAWFAFLGTIISHQFIKKKIGKFQTWAERLMGVIMIIFGIKIGLF